MRVWCHHRVVVSSCHRALTEIFRSFLYLARPVGAVPKAANMSSESVRHTFHHRNAQAIVGWPMKSHGKIYLQCMVINTRRIYFGGWASARSHCCRSYAEQRCCASDEREYD